MATQDPFGRNIKFPNLETLVNEDGTPNSYSEKVEEAAAEHNNIDNIINFGCLEDGTVINAFPQEVANNFPVPNFEDAVMMQVLWLAANEGGGGEEVDSDDMPSADLPGDDLPNTEGEIDVNVEPNDDSSSQSAEEEPEIDYTNKSGLGARALDKIEDGENPVEAVSAAQAELAEEEEDGEPQNSDEVVYAVYRKLIKGVRCWEDGVDPRTGEDLVEDKEDTGGLNGDVETETTSTQTEISSDTDDEDLDTDDTEYTDDESDTSSDTEDTDDSQEKENFEESALAQLFSR